MVTRRILENYSQKTEVTLNKNICEEYFYGQKNTQRYGLIYMQF